MVSMESHSDFKAWLSSQPSSVHSLVLGLANDSRYVNDFAQWLNVFFEKYAAIDWTEYPSSFGTVENEHWRSKALADLRDWMLASSQPSVTADTWASVYIRCGRCLTEWRQWCEDNPIGDLASWIDAASEVAAAKRWI
jgi:hypothetical protein